MSFIKRDHLTVVAKGLLADAQFCLNEAETQLALIAQSETEAELAERLKNFIELFKNIESFRALADHKIGLTLCRLWEFD